MTRLKTNREGKGRGLTPDLPFLLQILPYLPEQMRRERKAKHYLKASCAKKGGFSQEAELTGSTKQIFFSFFLKLPGCTNCLVHSHLASCPNPGSPGAAALTHPSSTDFPQGAPHLAVPSHTLQVALQFSLEPTVIFPKAIYICMNCGKEKQMQYLVKQYQIHQFCAPL